ncbi:penicillin-binding transpeptidase domain-containing protein [Paenibacillus sp. MZ04-78.2]|uniref:peptidoglycan D,D-transpeptidase FtsI family protein n=1 Tax=Paenibacillus sp. MZ04-78.2 TaxID=2962034 RepID=UPI0020B81A6C|nr:penicillin-binding transpeptidase domain-containing protein [Paenibacillus sp. MZ04-78.2]MCP3773923.1 penicillin-binding transpeptidase domain-containing protein [Paenibacillus sp. MZ04-78.2]
MDNGTKLQKNRIFIVLLLLIGVLAAWNLRLFWIQVAVSRSLTERKIDLVENSVIQRAQGLVLDSGRGDFTDRNGVPLTGTAQKVLVVFPIREEESAGNDTAAAMDRVASIVNAPLSAWQPFVRQLKGPAMWSVSGRPAPLTDAQASKIEALGLKSVRAMTFKQRYAERQPASQALGFIGQNPERITRQFTDQIHKGELQLTSKIGNSGLEKTFEPWLQGIGPSSVSLFTDGLKRPLPGLDTRQITPSNPYYPLKVVTTLDSGIQQQIERTLERLHVTEGAVVVLDIRNGDTIAMASMPAFHPEHIDLVQGNWSNKALKAAAPGSIFKTVTAAAALEEKAVKADETFDCTGALGKYGFTCWKKEGHGRLTLEEGFAQSCNIVYAKVAQRLGGDKLEAYAHRLGLEMPVGWSGDVPHRKGFRQWDAEEQGQVYAAASDKSDEGALVQTAIGQRDVLMTPLQAANLIVTLYNQGEIASPRIVREIRFRNERLYLSFPSHELKQAAKPIKPVTAKRLLEWMAETVEHGTGKALRSAKWSLAGKSGTAQVRLKNGRPGENHWFIGYGPVEQPHYAAAVLVQNVPEGGSHRAIPLFKEVMNILADSSKREN